MAQLNGPLLQQFTALHAQGHKAFALLIDPDDCPPPLAPVLAQAAEQAGVHCLLVGGSLVTTPLHNQLVQALKAATSLPVLLFPGHLSQLAPQADGLLFLSLLSGRNPDLLIGQHVHAAPLLQAASLEVLPTGYLLFDTGLPTAASYMSHSPGLPPHKPELAAYTALAGEYLGLRLIYADAGSGAQAPIPAPTITAMRAALSLPLIVGGGLRTASDIATALEAGADVVVLGSALEDALHQAPAAQAFDTLYDRLQHLLAPVKAFKA